MTLPLFDVLAAAVFAVFWLGYEPLLRRLGEGRLINTDMTVIRRAWMVRACPNATCRCWMASCWAMRSIRRRLRPRPTCC